MRLLTSTILVKYLSAKTQIGFLCFLSWIFSTRFHNCIISSNSTCSNAWQSGYLFTSIRWPITDIIFGCVHLDATINFIQPFFNSALRPFGRKLHLYLHSPFCPFGWNNFSISNINFILLLVFVFSLCS